MPAKRSLVALSVLLALVGAACGSSDGSDPAAQESADANFSDDLSDAEVYPIFISSEIVVGENRFLVGLLDENDAPIGDPDVKVDIAFFDLERSSEQPAFETDTRFTWIDEDAGRGVWVAYPEFSRAGNWGAEVRISGGGYDENVKGSFEVAAEGTTPAIGAPAPKSDTPTADDVKKLEEITTDPRPDPKFYETSIAEAIAQHEPFVVVFATPKFCTSQVCGPTLDDVKAVSEDYPKITYIHSEIYEDLDPTKPPVEAVREWGLPGEPWVFVVDRAGQVAAKFEGSASPEELSEVLDKL
ncbi:MAG: TlpA family protein disulfide reductase [Actinomycetota bacterium]